MTSKNTYRIYVMSRLLKVSATFHAKVNNKCLLRNLCLPYKAQCICVVNKLYFVNCVQLNVCG